MTKTCPACGSVSNAEARFCRTCGALLPRARDLGDDAVSPHASTIPLSGIDSATGPLSPHDTGSPNRSPTANLQRGEIDELLQRLSGAESKPPTADNATPSRADAATEEQTTDDARLLMIQVHPIEREAMTSDADALESLPISSSHKAHDTPAAVALADAKSPDEIARAPRSTETRALRLWTGAALFCVVAFIIAVCVLLAWYALHKLGRASS